MSGERPVGDSSGERTTYREIIPLGGNRIGVVRPEGLRTVTIVDIHGELNERVSGFSRSANEGIVPELS